MDFSYQARRVLASSGAFVGIAAALLVFLFPTTRFVRAIPPLTRGPVAITCFVPETEYISFRPLWNLGGLPPDVLGLVLEAGLALTLGVCVWSLYPALAVTQRRP